MFAPYRRRSIAAATLLMAVATNGCGSPAGADDKLRVATFLSRSNAAPGESVTVTLRAVPPGDARVQWITLVTSGVLISFDSAAFAGAGPQELIRTLLIPARPLVGTLTITGAASAGGVIATETRSVAVYDSVPPRLLTFEVSPRPAGPGDRLTVRFSARDTVGVKRVVVRVANSFINSDSIELAVARRSVVDSVRFTVPATAALNFPAFISIVVYDESGQRTESEVSLPISDTRGPAVDMTFGGFRTDQTFRSGDTLQIAVSASDNAQLRYVGYVLYDGSTTRRDSVTVSSSEASRTFRLPIPLAWRSRRPEVGGWARDAAGNLVTTPAFRPVPVYDWVNRSLTTAAFSNTDRPGDVVVDTKRGVAYVSRFDTRVDEKQVGSSQIEVISLSTGETGTPIPVPARPEALALTESRDSLIVTLPGLRAVGVVNLNAGVRTTAVVPLQYDTSSGLRSRAVKVAGSHILVALFHGLYPGRMLSIDLGTGAQVLRSDFGSGGALTQYPVLLQFTSPSRVLINPREEGYGSNASYVYAAASNTFSEAATLQPARDNQVSVSAAGRFLLATSVYDAAMTKVVTLAPQDWSGYELNGACISADGTTAYFATEFGYFNVRVSDGAVLDQVKLPMVPTRLLATPDGNSLIAIGFLNNGLSDALVVMIVDIR